MSVVGDCCCWGMVVLVSVVGDYWCWWGMGVLVSVVGDTFTVTVISLIRSSVTVSLHFFLLLPLSLLLLLAGCVVVVCGGGCGVLHSLKLQFITFFLPFFLS